MKPEDIARPTVEELNRNFDAALNTRLRAEYQRGLEQGLRTAKVIRGWLTRQPDRVWQKRVREWADKEIIKAERMPGSLDPVVRCEYDNEQTNSG